VAPHRVELRSIAPPIPAVAPDLPAILADVPGVAPNFPTIPSQFSLAFIGTTIGAEVPDIQPAVPAVPVEIANVSANLPAVLDPVALAVQAEMGRLLRRRARRGQGEQRDAEQCESGSHGVLLRVIGGAALPYTRRTSGWIRR
jgi:hypothetical protein